MDQRDVGALQRIIGGLEVGLAGLIEKTAQQTGRSREEIELALEDLGYLAPQREPASPDSDPYEKLRRVATHLKWLRSILSEQKRP